MSGRMQGDRGRAGARLRLAAVAGVSALSLAACASLSPQGPRPVASTPKPSGGQGASAGPRYKVGAPYQIGGVWYVPAEQPDYDEVGVASWYGDEFDGRPTANGERFDMYSASAAHTTLPMPSVVEVTNLDNGRSMRLRLNDRGPFKAGRIIDVSRGAAKELGFLEKGLARVRVRYIGPARLDGATEPLYVAKATPPLRPPSIAPALAPTPTFTRPASQLATISSNALPPAAASTWNAQPAWSSQPSWSPPEPAFGDGFAVQAGAFADRAKAERIAQALQSAGAAEVRPFILPERTLYRVVLGPWRDEDRAAAARAQVVALGYADARVVRAF